MKVSGTYWLQAAIECTTTNVMLEAMRYLQKAIVQMIVGPIQATIL